MKKLLLFFTFLFSFIAYSQESFDQDWYDKLDSPLEYIVYENDNTGLYSIRIYRGDAAEHWVTIKDCYGNSLYNQKIPRDTELDLHFLSCGHYIIEISNSKATRVQIIKIR